MPKGSDQEALSHQQGSETSGHGDAKVRPIEECHPDLQRRIFSGSKFSQILSGELFQGTTRRRRLFVARKRHFIRALKGQKQAYLLNFW